MKTRITLLIAILGLGILFTTPLFSDQPQSPAQQIAEKSKQPVPTKPLTTTVTPTPAAAPIPGPTVPIQKLTLLSPNGGEKLVQGSLHKISWMPVDGNNIDSYSLFLSIDNGKTWQTIKEGIPNKENMYVWTVDAVPTEQGLVKIMARSPVALEIADQSDQTFSIMKQPPPPVTTPK